MKIEKAKLLRNFISDKDYLNGDIDKLKTFSFWNIAGTKYDGTAEDANDSNFDGDHTILAKAIYWVLWENKGIPNFSQYNFDQIENSYSGDTINTYNTLFGSTQAIQSRVFKLLNFSPDEEKEIGNFRQKYQTIGNFYFLPKNTIYKESINTYRGTRWHDYFDIFLKVLKSGLENKESIDFTFKDLLDKNDFFFKEINSIEKFCKIFYLQDEEENYNFLTDLTFEGNVLHFTHSMLCEENKEDYKTFALSYIRTVTPLIEKRSNVIVRELRKVLSL